MTLGSRLQRADVSNTAGTLQTISGNGHLSFSQQTHLHLWISSYSSDYNFEGAFPPATWVDNESNLEDDDEW